MAGLAATHEPAVKKSRRTRILELDLSQFPDWVSTANESTLLEVFAVGVKVKDLITINITENPKYIKKVLGENLKPVYDDVKDMSTKIGAVQNNVAPSLNNMRSDTIQFQAKLVNDVQGVAAKVPPLDSLTTKMDNAILKLQPDLTSLKPMIQRCDTNLTRLVNLYEKPATKGALGEREVQKILEDRFPDYAIENVGHQGKQADILITSMVSQKTYLVEVKDHKNAVPAKEIEKFEKDVRDNMCKVGILFSLRSGIHVRASHRRFQVKFQDDKYYIYVPYALQDGDDLIFWIVVLADQLAALNQGLTDSQTRAVADLLQEFQKSSKEITSCENNLKTLRKTVAELEENMKPLVKIIEKTKGKLNKILHQKQTAAGTSCKKDSETFIDID